MINNLLLVGVGGFLGSGLRYYVQHRFQEMDWSNHWAVMSVNLVGSLLIGILAAYLVKDHHATWRFVFIAGFCGGFTTFSSFSLDNLTLLREGQATEAIGYTLLSLIGCVSMTFLGFFITEKIVNT